MGTKDLKTSERLPDLKTRSPQQRNVVLHPEFVDGQYAFHARPQDDFIQAGSGGGIAWGLSERMNPAVVDAEMVLDTRVYHTIKEVKNGEGPAPLKTDRGWLHLAHGVTHYRRWPARCALPVLERPQRAIEGHASPGGYLLAPVGQERVVDVSNVTFSNGWVARADGTMFIY